MKQLKVTRMATVTSANILLVNEVKRSGVTADGRWDTKTLFNLQRGIRCPILYSHSQFFILHGRSIHHLFITKCDCLLIM